MSVGGEAAGAVLFFDGDDGAFAGEALGAAAGASFGAATGASAGEASGEAVGDSLGAAVVVEAPATPATPEAPLLDSAKRGKL